VKTDKIYLVGFMGAGKSTVARALARRLDWRAEDIDERIEQYERRDIACFVRQQGEPYFRALERAALVDLLPARGTVVASGGGTFVEPGNRGLMLGDGLVIWLDVPFRVVLDRVPLDGRRPLAGDRQSLEELYNQRLTAYRLAPVRIDASRGPVDLLVDQIVDGLET
jgi:shikimate kinase